MKANNERLCEFIRQSNWIEGITGFTDKHVEVHNTFIALDEITIADLSHFVNVIQPDAVLRDRIGLDMYIGKHTPLKGGPRIPVTLSKLLAELNEDPKHTGLTPYIAHHEYETLHPFTDGNGRSGRALWLWMMVKYQKYDMERLFLHEWYYQSLEADQE